MSSLSLSCSNNPLSPIFNLSSSYHASRKYIIIIKNVLYQMASFESKKTKDNSLAEMDTISNLPDDVKEKILNYLPLKEAGRMSILSSKWRYTWASIPKLTFYDDEDNPNPNFVEFVDTIFVLHNGPIRTFNLYTREDYFKAFDRWIVNLSRNGVRRLELNVSGNEYIIHSGFFSCEELKFINLTCCSFKVPFNFKGFKHLQTLALTCLRVSGDDIQKLISSCPILERLILKDLWGDIALNIHAPNLLSLEIEGEYSDLQVCSQKLLSLIVMPRALEHQDGRINIRRVLINVPNLETFELNGYCLSYLFNEPLREGFSLSFNCLKILDLHLKFDDEKEAASVLSLFQSAPHLQSLDIYVYLREAWPTLPIAKFWETINRREDLFKHLQTVYIFDFKAVDSILSFVEFILGSAPQLMTLTIKKDSEDQRDEGMMFRQLLEFERASPKAKIIFK